MVEISHRQNYLVSGRTDIRNVETNRVIGSYSRLGRVYDSDDLKAGRWRDAQSWNEELKENLVDAVAWRHWPAAGTAVAPQMLAGSRHTNSRPLE